MPTKISKNKKGESQKRLLKAIEHGFKPNQNKKAKREAVLAMRAGK